MRSSSTTGRTEKAEYQKLEIGDDKAKTDAPTSRKDISPASSIGRQDEMPRPQPSRSTQQKCLGYIPLSEGDTEEIKE